MAESASTGKRSIVIAYDLTIQSEDAIDFYCEHAKRDSDYVILLNCSSRVGEGQEQTGTAVLATMVQEEMNRMDRDRKMMEKELKQRKLDGKVIITVGDVVDKLAETAKEEDATLIIMGARFIGKKTREQTGSTKSRVVQSQHIEVPILIVRRQGVQKTTKERIAVLGTDLKKPSLNAMSSFATTNRLFASLSHQQELAEVGRTERALSSDQGKSFPPVKFSPDVAAEEKERLDDETDRLRHKLKEMGMEGTVHVGDPKYSPGQSIVNHAASVGANLVVLGSRCVGETTRQFTGESTTDFVLNTCKMSVLVVKF